MEQFLASANTTLASTLTSAMDIVVNSTSIPLQNSSDDYNDANGDITSGKIPHIFDYTEPSNNLTTSSSPTGLQPVLNYVELCKRLSPPPIPPWLLDAPDKLRRLVANCSSWKKYTDMCSLQVPPEYPHALAEYPDSGSVAIQWIPFIVGLLLAVFIIVFVVVIYMLYRTNRVKLDFFAEYHKHGRYSQNYYDPGNVMSPSVTVETQLSVCAMEDDSCAAIIPSHMMYTDRTHSKTHKTRSPGVSVLSSPASASGLYQRKSLPSEEIILHPNQLVSDDFFSSLYVNDMSGGGNFYSSHSLPMEPESGKPEATFTRKQSKSKKAVIKDDEIQDSPYVSFHKRKKSKSDNSACGTLDTNNDFPRVQENKRSLKGIVNRCRKAGVSLVHGVIWNRTPGPNNGLHVQAIPNPTLYKLRQSLSNRRILKPKPCSKFQSLDNESLRHSAGSTTDALQREVISQQCSPSSSIANDALPPGEQVSATHSHDSDYCTRGKYKGKDRLFKNSSENDKVQNSSSGFVNEAFVEAHGQPVSKVKRLSFKRIKLPGVLQKISKGNK